MTPTNAATQSANRTSLLSWEAIAEPHVPDRGPPSIPPDRRPNISLRDAVKLHPSHGRGGVRALRHSGTGEPSAAVHLRQSQHHTFQVQPHTRRPSQPASG